MWLPTTIKFDKPIKNSPIGVLVLPANIIPNY